MGTLDVLSIGDVATDVFIRLIDERVEVREGPSGGLRQLVLPFGEKVPFEHAETVPAGGNAANAAVCCARLGLATALVSHVGDDASGRDVLDALRRAEVDTRFVRIDAGVATNRNFVLWFGADRTILVHHEAYDYRFPDLRPTDLPRWAYLSSAGSGAAGYYDEIAGFLEAEPSVRFAFQPGTLQIALGAARLSRLYRRAEVLVCNREEAAAISGQPPAELRALVESLHALGPSVVVVTDGPSGAYASDRTRRLFVDCLPDEVPPLDRTGAGDAFAATVVAGLAHGEDLAVALEAATVNARSVVHRLGSQAGLLDAAELDAGLEKVPAGWGVRRW